MLSTSRDYFVTSSKYHVCITSLTLNIIKLPYNKQARTRNLRGTWGNCVLPWRYACQPDKQRLHLRRRRQRTTVYCWLWEWNVEAFTQRTHVTWLCGHRSDEIMNTTRMLITWITETFESIISHIHQEKTHVIMWSSIKLNY